MHKRQIERFVGAFAAALFVAGHAAAQPQLGSEFSYQGQLTKTGNPLNDTADFEFTLWDAATDGRQIGRVVAVNNVALVEGLFTVQIDFGVPAFNGDKRWLKIAVRSPAGSGKFTTLDPRQPLTAAPYALQTRGIFVDANHNVGIGTTTPINRLDVDGAIRSFGTSGGNILAENPNNPRAGVSLSWLNDVARLRISGEGPGSDNGFDIQRTGSRSLMRITGAGTVGIGTTAPRAKLHVVGDGASTVMRLTNGGSGGGTALVAVDVSGTGKAASFYGATSNVLVTVQNDGTGKAATIVARDADEPALYAVNGSSSGKAIAVHCASRSASGRAMFAHATATSGQNYGVWSQTDSTSGRGVIGLAQADSGQSIGVWGQSNSPNGFDFYAAGVGVHYGSSSSCRWKNNIEPIDELLDKLAQLRGVYYEWDDEHGGYHDVGMIAEEVGKVLPEIVQYEKNGIDAIGMDYSKLTPLLVEAVNALRAEKNAEIAMWRNKNTELEVRLERIEAMLSVRSSQISGGTR